MDDAHVRILGAVGLALTIIAAVAVPTFATHEEPEEGLPADRVTVAGSSLEVMTSSVSDGSTSETVEILHTQMRTSNPADLVLQVTLECALWTEVTTVGNDEQRAEATVTVWIEVDGQPVQVSDTDDGKAVFCNRDYEVTTFQFDDEDATIERYLETRAANGFNWVAEDLGEGVHDIVVKAQLEGQATSNAEAKAAIGQRTLVVQPTFLVNNGA